MPNFWMMLKQYSFNCLRKNERALYRKLFKKNNFQQELIQRSKIKISSLLQIATFMQIVIVDCLSQTVKQTSDQKL